MKNKVFFVVIAGLIVVLGLFTVDSFKAEKSLDDILSDAFNKYEIQSFQRGEGFSDVYIDVYDIRDASKIEKYIKRNLPAEDREKYNIEIFSLEETQKLKPLKDNK